MAVLPYSSGTTGRPKGVMLSHRNLVANAEQSRGLLKVTPEDRLLALLPFFHIYGLTVLLNLALRQRACLVTMPKFELAEFLRIIQDQRCSYLFIAPPVAVALSKHPLVADYDLSSVHTTLSGAAPLDGELGGSLAERLGCRVLQGYGMTEMSPVSHLIPVDATELPVSSVGYTVPNMDCRLLDPATGEDLDIPAEGTSAPGHLLCRGPNVMLGYLNRPEETADTLDADGFLRTGDIATVRADGVVTIVDRLKELIKYKGYQIAPAELEALLLTHPGIADAAVIGTSDADGQEVPMAFVVRQPGHDGEGLDEAAVMDYVAEGWRRSRRSAGSSSLTPCRSPPPARSCAGCSRRLAQQPGRPATPALRPRRAATRASLSWRCRRRRGRCGPRSWQRSRARGPAPSSAGCRRRSAGPRNGPPRRSGPRPACRGRRRT